MSPPTNLEPQLPALQALGAQFSRLSDLPDPDRTPRRRSALGRAAVVAGATALLLAFLAFTPPGRSVADAVGDLVGIGDDAPARPGEKAVYIGVGDAAESYRYEVIASTNNAESGNPETCFELRFPDLDTPFTIANCITDEPARQRLQERGFAPFLYPAPRQFGPDAGIVVQGPVAPEVERVSVNYTAPDGSQHKAPVYMSSLDERLSRQIGARDQAGFIVALLPLSILHGTAEDPKTLSEGCTTKSLSAVNLTAFNADDDAIATLNLGNEHDARSLMAFAPAGFSSPIRAPSPGGMPPTDESNPPQPYQPDTSQDCDT
jgi:hypothetical protein